MEKAGFNQPKTQPLTALPTSPGPCWLGKAALQNMVRRDADSSRVWFRALVLLRSSRMLLLPGTWRKRAGTPITGASHFSNHRAQASYVNKHKTQTWWKPWLFLTFPGKLVPLPGTLLPGCPTSLQTSFLYYILYETVPSLSVVQSWREAPHVCLWHLIVHINKRLYLALQ